MDNNGNESFTSIQPEKREPRERKKGEPTFAFIASAWASLIVGIGAYMIGLWNATMMLNEKGYYFTLLLFGLFSAVSLQKSVRDIEDDIPVTGIYYGICWFSLLAAITLLAVGLWNADLTRSEKGFYAMSYILCLFSSITVQKNVRDIANLEDNK